jgi:membrane protease YdiL (CAAX protease family)
MERVAETPGGLVLVVAGNVLSTAVAGAVFAWLRLRSGSLLAPALAHLGTNDISFGVGWLFNRLS